MTKSNEEIELNQYLNIGEHFVWTGKPKTGIAFRKYDILVIPLGFIWSIFMILWILLSIVSDVHVVGKLVIGLVGIPFVAIGLYMLIGKFLIDAKRRDKTIYGITQERIIIKSGLFNKGVKSLYIKNLTDINMTEKINGTGTISFTPICHWYSMKRGGEWTEIRRMPKLEFIENARYVYQKIIDTKKQNDIQ